MGWSVWGGVCGVGGGGGACADRGVLHGEAPVDHNQEFYATAASTEFFEWVFCSLLVCVCVCVWGRVCAGGRGGGVGGVAVCVGGGCVCVCVGVCGLGWVCGGWGGVFVGRGLCGFAGDKCCTLS